MLYKNVGVDGVKTGYLAVEKYSLASSMKKNDRRVIAVASGFETKNFRSSESLKLLNWGFRNTSTFEISKKNDTKFEIETWLGNKNNDQNSIFIANKLENAVLDVLQSKIITKDVGGNTSTTEFTKEITNKLIS